MNDIVDQLERYHSLMRPSGLAAGSALSPNKAELLGDAAAEIKRLRANNDWLSGRLRDAVNVCYGGVSHEEIDAHQ